MTSVKGFVTISIICLVSSSYGMIEIGHIRQRGKAKKILPLLLKEHEHDIQELPVSLACVQ